MKKKNILKLIIIIILIVIFFLILISKFCLINNTTEDNSVASISDTNATSDISNDDIWEEYVNYQEMENIIEQIYSDTDSDDEEITSLDVPSSVPVGTAELSLNVTYDGVYVGEMSKVSFVVKVPNKTYHKAVIVNVKDGSVLTTLKKQRITDNETVEIYGDYFFIPEKSDFMTIRAYAGEDYSKYSIDGYISIIDRITDEENDEFVEVVSDLGDYVNGLKGDMTKSELLDAVEKWLNENSSIAETYREDNIIYYITNGGITSSFSVGNPMSHY